MIQFETTLRVLLVCNSVWYGSAAVYSLGDTDISYHACLMRCAGQGWSLPMTKSAAEFSNFQNQMDNLPLPGIDDDIIWMGLRKDWCSGNTFWQDGEGMTFVEWATLAGEPSNYTDPMDRREWCHYFRTYESYRFSTMWCHYPKKIIHCMCSQELIIPTPIVYNQPSCAGSNGYSIDTSPEDYIKAKSSCSANERLVTLDTQSKSKNFKDFMDEEVSDNE